MDSHAQFTESPGELVTQLRNNKQRAQRHRQAGVQLATGSARKHATFAVNFPFLAGQKKFKTVAGLLVDYIAAL